MGFGEAYGKGSGSVVVVSVAGRQGGGVGGLQDKFRLEALPAKITPVSEFSKGGKRYKLPRAVLVPFSAVSMSGLIVLVSFTASWKDTCPVEKLRLICLLVA